MKLSQRGGFVLGLIVGLLAGLAIALGVALYITKAPVPFINKVPQRTAEQDTAETERNRNWDPNAPLAGKPAAPKPQAPAQATAPAALPTLPPGPPAAASAPQPGRDPAAILAGTAPALAPYVFFVQAGAYTRSEEAEQQRAKVALLGLSAGISEREQAGRTVHRVRIGPYETREEADAVQARLTQANIDSRMVRAERE